MFQINRELDISRKREKRNVEELIKKAKTSSIKAEYEKVRTYATATSNDAALLRRAPKKLKN